MKKKLSTIFLNVNCAFTKKTEIKIFYAIQNKYFLLIYIYIYIYIDIIFKYLNI